MTDPRTPRTEAGRRLMRSTETQDDGTWSGLDLTAFRDAILAIEAEASLGSSERLAAALRSPDLDLTALTAALDHIGRGDVDADALWWAVLDDEDTFARAILAAHRMPTARPSPARFLLGLTTTDHPDVRAGLEALVEAATAFLATVKTSAHLHVSEPEAGTLAMAIMDARAALSATSEPT
jgi:hypothetical protein